jgi:hypothetical protein
MKSCNGTQQCLASNRQWCQQHDVEIVENADGSVTVRHRAGSREAVAQGGRVLLDSQGRTMLNDGGQMLLTHSLCDAVDQLREEVNE